MVPLARRLKRAGREPIKFGYPSHRGCLEDMRGHYKLLRSSEPFSVLAHSMGGLVARLALQHVTYRASRCVFIATHTEAARTRDALGKAI